MRWQSLKHQGRRPGSRQGVVTQGSRGSRHYEEKGGGGGGVGGKRQRNATEGSSVVVVEEGLPKVCMASATVLQTHGDCSSACSCPCSILIIL